MGSLPCPPCPATLPDLVTWWESTVVNPWDPRVRETWLQIPALPLIPCVTLDKALYLPLSFLSCKMGITLAHISQGVFNSHAKDYRGAWHRAHAQLMGTIINDKFAEETCFFTLAKVSVLESCPRLLFGKPLASPEGDFRAFQGSWGQAHGDRVSLC